MAVLCFTLMLLYMIETYEILHGIYDLAVSPDLSVCQHSVTRSNNYKLVKNQG